MLRPYGVPDYESGFTKSDFLQEPELSLPWRNPIGGSREVTTGDS